MNYDIDILALSDVLVAAIYAGAAVYIARLFAAPILRVVVNNCLDRSAERHLEEDREP